MVKIKKNSMLFPKPTFDYLSTLVLCHMGGEYMDEPSSC